MNTAKSVCWAILCVVVALVLSGAQARAQNTVVASRVTQAVDESHMVQLHGNVHPLARPQFDTGVAPAGLPMARMLLMLKRSPEQEAALAELMTEQQDAASVNFHKWLTPEEFGALFGPSDADVSAVTSWLQSHGFELGRVSKGKIAIEFSGTAAQLQEAFHTSIHSYVVNGKSHWANANEPEVPAALAPVIAGFASLNSFYPKPLHHLKGEYIRSKVTGEVTGVNPAFTTSGGNYALGPWDFATIYNVLPQWNAGPIDGTGQRVAVAGVSNINLQDVTDFRTLFNLPLVGNPPAAPVNVVIDGADPGILTDGSETESLLDTEWAGAIAKGATIDLVIAADTNDASGLLLAVVNVIDNNSDPILSVSFSSCESNGVQFMNGVWQQAAAQGITATVATGDNGSAGCENQSAPAPNPATTGLQVNGFASTPFNVAVGGTDFNDATTQSNYFHATNDLNFASAIGYIPETTWNDSCTNALFGTTNGETNCNNATNAGAIWTVAGSGGASTCGILNTAGTACQSGYPKPAFQQLVQPMPNDSVRDIPDVSLFASDGGPMLNGAIIGSRSFYVVCQADLVTTGVSCNKAGSFHFIGVGGTSAATPAFAGIMALVNQYQLAHGGAGRQGNANYALYQLASQQIKAGTACNSTGNTPPAAGCTFNDVTTGTIAMPCTTGSANCVTNTGSDKYGVLNGYSAGAGYDLATGLGSVNVANLVNNWTKGLAALAKTTTTLLLNNGNPVNVVHGSKVPVNITVTPAAVTGAVALVSTATTGQGVDGFSLTNGATVCNPAPCTTNQLTGGTYTVTAHYPGDGIYGPSDSAPVSVTVSAQNSLTVASSYVSTSSGIVAATSAPFPGSFQLRADVSDNPNSGNFLASGTVDFVDNGTTTVASKVNVNSESAAFTAPIALAVGNHSIVAKYSGDPSFNPSTSGAIALTVTTAPTATSVSSSLPIITAGQTVTLTAIVGSNSASSQGPTGMVQFKNGGTSLGGPVTCTPAGATATVGASCTAMLTTAISALYPPAGNRPRVPSMPLIPSIVALVCALLFALGWGWMPGPRRRAYAYAGLVAFALLAVGIAGCGGGSSGGGGGGGNIRNITAVYAGDTNYAGSTSPNLPITVN